MQRLAQASDFAVETLRREPEFAEHLSAPLVGESGLLRDRLQAWLAEGPADAAPARLRRFRRRECARIVWHDVVGDASCEEILTALSALGDACIHAALDLAANDLGRRYGVARDRSGNRVDLVVLGMGKLGGRELNFSSDVDLVFAYPVSGQTDGARTLSNEEYFTRLGRRLVELLDERTADGFVYRVDMRLRPYGSAGRLALSFDALEHYYQREGRDWERYALIKARPVAGDIAAGESLLRTLQPFVYRRYLDFAALDALREMKATIARETAARDLRANVKLGPGGIREIEFMVQSMQLVWGGRERELRTQSLLQALHKLATLGLVPSHQAAVLAEDYRRLRQVENRLQMRADRQTHELPVDPSERARLAESLGFADWPGFADALGETRDRVGNAFAAVLAASDEAQDGDPALSAWQAADAPEAIAAMDELGLRPADEAARRLLELRESARLKLASPMARARIDKAMPRLIRAVADVEPSAALLARMLELIDAVARRSAYVSLLLENPKAMERLVRLFARSAWTADLVTRRPVLLDELLDLRAVDQGVGAADVDAQFRHELLDATEGDLEAEMNALREAHGALRLRIAGRRLDGASSLREGADALTLLAEKTIRLALQLAWRDVGSAHGSEPPMAVVAYGTVGGCETHFGSDLDLVFLHADDVDHPQRLIRVAQRAIHVLTTLTAAGRLYEVDTRLRPNGSSGLLVSSMRSFREYQSAQAWTWEHQALIRARVVAGQRALAGEFEHIRRDVLSRERDPSVLHQDVVEMRAKMRGELDRSGSGRFDAKQGRGGLADIAFMTQHGVLASAARHSDVLAPRHTCDLLRALAAAKIFDEKIADLLATAWKDLVSRIEARSLQQQSAMLQHERVADRVREVSEIWALFEKDGGPALAP